MNRHLRFLISGAGLRLLVYAAAVLIGFFLTPYLLKVLGDREYAVFVFAGLFTNWCGLADFGLTTSSARFVTLAYSRGEPRRLNETASTSLFLFACAGAAALFAAGVGALLCRWRAPSSEASVYAAVLLFAGGAFAVSKIADAFSGVINGVMRQELTGIAALVYRLALGGVTFLIAWSGGHVAAIAAGGLGVSLLNLLFLVLLARAAWPPLRLSPKQVRKERAGELLSYSVYTFVQQLGNLLIRRSDLVVIGTFLSLTDVTHYNLAVVTFASYFVTLTEELTIWQTNWFTHLAQRNEEALFEKTRVFSYKVMTYLSVFMALILIFWARDFIRFWVGAEYLDAFPCLVILAAGMAFYRGAADVNVRLLQGTARHQLLAPLAIGQGAAGIILAIAAVRMGFGKIGVASATILPAIAVSGIVVPILVCRRRKERAAVYFARNLRFCFTAAAAFLPSWVLIRYTLAPSPFRLGTVLLLSAFFWLTVIGFIGFNRDERRMMISFFRKKRPAQS
ncbi:MAG: oligosaccharide flippase family protein [Thermoguttaceae bacterium]|nr:oligosaccharide flippase family protein [Thermoguttaceae bacterium]